MRDVPVVVTGGAGYIGSVLSHSLSRAGARVTVLDTLVAGHREAVGALPLAVVDVRDTEGVGRVLRETGARAVCHLAALADIPASFADPARCEDVNVGGTESVLEAMAREGVEALVFASTCAIYAAPSEGRRVLREGDPEAPDSPYARSKQQAEGAVRAAEAKGAVRAAALRFFNAAGADREACVGEAHEPETHAVPRLLRWCLGRGTFTVFGADHPTRDGTCVRDYVHVVDIARAYLLALEGLLGGSLRLGGPVNIGAGVGVTVRELVERACARTGVSRRPEVGPRRAGDAPVLLAEPSLAKALLGWAPRYDLDAILEDALWWEQRGRAWGPHGERG